MLPQFVWDASVLEGNPFTFPEVQTVMDGITVGGHKLSDERQVENLVTSAKELDAVVKSGRFELTKAMSDRLHALVAKDEAFDAGYFRGEGSETRITPGVALGVHGTYRPAETVPGGQNLRDLHSRGLDAIGRIPDRFEQGLVYFLFGALHQFYFDGNKPTARYMMNGHLMSGGLDAISIPAARGSEFNTRMVDFFRTRDGTDMLVFLAGCHPDAEELGLTTSG